jgi:hypothetical protein
MTKTPLSKPKANNEVVILFGTGENERPCGARFAGVDNLLLFQAANAANFHYFVVDTPELQEVAKQLPAGRVLGGGKLVIPPVKKEIYAQLLDFMDDDDLPPNSAVLSPEGPGALPRPKSWDDITKGHLVIAQSSIAFGWWEAVVVERTKDILTLRWRDYPKHPPFQQYVSAVALTPVSAAPAT